MFSTNHLRGVAVAFLSVSLCVPAVQAQSSEAQSDAAPSEAGFGKARQRGIDFLLSKHEKGRFLHDDEAQLGMSALALAAVLTKPAPQRTDDEKAYIAAATDYILGQQNEDGSFGKAITNYQTSAVTLALAKLGTDRVAKPLEKAVAFIMTVQNAEANGVSPDHKDYGGFGYGPGSRGDLSNTQFAIEALRAAGVEADHEAFARAVRFLQRTQNLRSVNDFRSETVDPDTEEKHPVEPGDDGGAVYFPGNSKFGFDVVADGVRVPRSYGSMTYALLKTYALCGLGPDDERMKAASNWLKQHWTLDSNPGTFAGLDEDAQYQGLFYYYETMARALHVCGVDEVETAGDEKVDWRAALEKHLLSMQRDDGSWLNEKNGRWWEDQPVMCTVYALLALADCEK